MEYCGIDVHKRECQMCVVNEEGDVVTEVRFPTDRDAFVTWLKDHARSKVLIEASTESEWVARHLEKLGHEVVVADPNFAPMYASRHKKQKTDLRDARALAHACRLGNYRAAHRTSETQRRVRSRLAVREVLVRARTRIISVVRSSIRSEGLRVPSGGTEHFKSRVEGMSLPDFLREELRPLLDELGSLCKHIGQVDEDLARIAADDPRVERLRTVPGVGPVTATAFVATVDEVGRFEGAHQVSAYLGLVPSEHSSGDHQIRGRITKTGNGRMRYLLVQAAHTLLRLKGPETLALRTWAMALKARRGRQITVVAVARKLSGILFAMLRDGTPYRPARILVSSS